MAVVRVVHGDTALCDDCLVLLKELGLTCRLVDTVELVELGGGGCNILLWELLLECVKEKFLGLFYFSHV